MAYLLGIKIEKIYIYPLGGISKFNMDLNISIKKERFKKSTFTILGRNIFIKFVYTYNL